MPRRSAGRGIGGHTMANNGAFDTWLTPPAILQALGHFHLDPCAAPSPRPWSTADCHFELPVDGLEIEWNGRVWLNPPYGEVTGKWLAKLANHRNGIALIFARTETEYWAKHVWPFTSGVLFVEGRLNFHLPDGTRASGNAGGPSALIAYGEENGQILRYSQIRGAFNVPLLRQPSTAQG